MSFVANLLENTTVKEFWKSAYICHERLLRHSFYWNWPCIVPFWNCSWYV